MSRIETNKKIIEIVNTIIRKEARDEALAILDVCSEARFNEFMTYYINKKESICCMVLDVAKSELVGINQMIHNEDDHFGWPYLNVNQKDN